MKKVSNGNIGKRKGNRYIKHKGYYEGLIVMETCS